MAEKYRTIRPCWHNKHYYNVGDEYVPVPGEKPPRHFVPIGGFTPEAVAKAEIEDRMSRRVTVKAQKAPKE